MILSCWRRGRNAPILDPRTSKVGSIIISMLWIWDKLSDSKYGLIENESEMTEVWEMHCEFGYEKVHSYRSNFVTTIGYYIVRNKIDYLLNSKRNLYNWVKCLGILKAKSSRPTSVNCKVLQNLRLKYKWTSYPKKQRSKCLNPVRYLDIFNPMGSIISSDIWSWL